MAKGYPDFFGQSIFPHYGAMNVIVTERTLTGVDAETITPIEMKGVLAGGTISIIPGTATDMDDLWVEFEIDGVMLKQIIAGQSDNADYTNREIALFRTIEATFSIPRFRYEIAHEINFINSVSFRLVNMDAALTCTYETELFYYHVT